MRPRGRTPRMLHGRERVRLSPLASMRPRGRTPRMQGADRGPALAAAGRFNEAAGAYPADACRWMGGATPAPATPSFNEAAGAYPADAPLLAGVGAGHFLASMRPRGRTPRMLPRPVRPSGPADASMRPRGRTPRMPRLRRLPIGESEILASMRPRGRTPRMRTARKSLRPNGLPQRLRAVSRRSVATVAATTTSGWFPGHNYPVVNDLPSSRALPGIAATPERSIRAGELHITLSPVRAAGPGTPCPG